MQLEHVTPEGGFGAWLGSVCSWLQASIFLFLFFEGNSDPLAMRWRMDFTDCDSTRCDDIASLLIAGLHLKKKKSDPSVDYAVENEFYSW